MMLAILHITVRAPRIRAHFNMDDVGISAAYVNRTDNLLKHTAAFHSREKDMIPYSRKAVRGCGVGNGHSLVSP